VNAKNASGESSAGSDNTNARRQCNYVQSNSREIKQTNVNILSVEVYKLKIIFSKHAIFTV
jgi:hypothetical protein